MDISSSSYFSASASTNKGMSGMISGMDTENMVKQMMMGTQGKIDAQEGLKQQTLWKQESYREIITSINGFHDKYFDSAFDSKLPNNFASAAFFNSMTSKVTSGDAVRVTGTSSNASPGDMDIYVKQLASNAELVAGDKMSDGKTIKGVKITADDLKSFEKTINLKVGDTDVSVNLNTADTDDEMITAFNNAFSKAKLTGVTAKMYGGKLRFVTADPSVKVALGKDSTALALTMTGLKDANQSPVNDEKGNSVGNMLEGGDKAQSGTGISFNLVLDGVQKTIDLSNVANDDGTIDLASIKGAVSKQVKQVFGNYIKVVDGAPDADGKVTTFDLQLNTSVIGEVGHELIVTGADAEKVGLTPGSSTRISTASTLDQLGLQGSRYSFSINDVNFTFTQDQTLGTVINTINNSRAGVKLSYSTMTDSFTMKTATTGSAYGISVKQSEGDLLTKIFGGKVNQASAAASKELTTDTIKGADGGISEEYRTESASMSFTVNGKNYLFSLPEKDDTTYSKSSIETIFNRWLNKTFEGPGEPKADGFYEDPNLKYENGKIIAKDKFIVQFPQTKVDLEDTAAVEAAKKYDLGLAFGFTQNAATNKVKNDTPLDQILQLKGQTLTKEDGSAANTLSEIRQINGFRGFYNGGRIDLSPLLDSGTLTASIDMTSTEGKKLVDLFGKGNADGKLVFGNGALNETTPGVSPVKAGTDAIFQVNGKETMRNSNTFTIDGLSLELTKTSKDATDITKIGVTRDVDKIVTGFKGLVEDYNKMLDQINGITGEKATYRKYPPLTAEQKKEMSDKEVELWEEKAQEGLLRGDSTVESFMSQMRTTLYTKPEGGRYALYNIGVETMQYKEKGKLKLDEAKLRDAFAADPDAIRVLFTDATEGLSKKLIQTMDAAAKESSGSPGTLVKMAGVGGGALEKGNTLDDKITGIESRIKDLKAKYESQRARYWKQFNDMERILSNYNQQSSYMAQQFSGGY